MRKTHPEQLTNWAIGPTRRKDSANAGPKLRHGVMAHRVPRFQRADDAPISRCAESVVDDAADLESVSVPEVIQPPTAIAYKTQRQFPGELKAQAYPGQDPALLSIEQHAACLTREMFAWNAAASSRGEGIVGKSGLGKARALLRFQRQRSTARQVHRCTLGGLCEALRHARARDELEFMFRKLASKHLLVFDEDGQTPIAFEEGGLICKLITQRRASVWTVVVTPRDIDDFDRWFPKASVRTTLATGGPEVWKVIQLSREGSDPGCQFRPVPEPQPTLSRRARCDGLLTHSTAVVQRCGQPSQKATRTSK